MPTAKVAFEIFDFVISGMSGANRIDCFTTLGTKPVFCPTRYLHFNWKIIGEPVLCAVAFLDGAILIAMAVTDEIWVAYAGYLAYR